MFYCILKLQFWNSKFVFLYPFSVKIMLKMHQKPFGGRTPPGPAGELKRSPRRSSDPLTAKWGLLLRGGEGRRGEGRGRESEGRRDRSLKQIFWLRHF